VNAFRFDKTQAFFGPDRDRHILPGDGASVLEPRHSDVARSEPQGSGEMLYKQFRGYVTLFDPQIEMFALTAWLVGGHFLDDEVLTFALEDAADSRERRGQTGAVGDYHLRDWSRFVELRSRNYSSPTRKRGNLLPDKR